MFPPTNHPSSLPGNGCNHQLQDRKIEGGEGKYNCGGREAKQQRKIRRKEEEVGGMVEMKDSQRKRKSFAYRIGKVKIGKRGRRGKIKNGRGKKGNKGMGKRMTGADEKRKKRGKERGKVRKG